MTEYAQLKIAGIDAKKFLQGQLTCNMDDITSNEPKLAALCNPQGRVISLFRIYWQDQAYYLIMPTSLISTTTETLKKYAVFFKVTMTTEPDTRTINPHAAVQNLVPEIYPETSGLFLPHDLRLPELNAVSFNKGCYTGQEIIARMEYRGKLKTKLFQGTVVTASSLQPGDALITKDAKTSNEIGTIINVCHHDNDVHHLLFIANDATATIYLANDLNTEVKRGIH